ncbi:MAG TPA: hypothetical protein PKY59_19380 [Pyrinomonadaceae bacterium]|nr:hypothetical protein [Pyrinomonadaceae bacterium]
MKNKFISFAALGILLLVSIACSFSASTAGLGDLKLAKDKDGNGASTTFKPNDVIFAVTAVNNSIGKNKVRFRVLTENVPGMQAGSVAYKLDNSIDVDGSRPIWFTFSAPDGFVAGTYKTEIVMSDESGKETDRKTATFTIAGDNTAKKPEAEKPASDDTKSADKDAEDH